MKTSNTLDTRDHSIREEIQSEITELKILLENKPPDIDPWLLEHWV